jgi:anaphase-promoting complex subunit 1
VWPCSGDGEINTVTQIFECGVFSHSCLLLQVNLQKGTSTLSGLEDLKIEERLQRYIFGSTEELNSNQRRSVSGSNAEGNQFEIDKDRNVDSYSINRDITAPGATLALGLMYIQSHNASVASILNLPNTHYLLDFVRPDLLALRVIARSLILWNDVEPTREWIDAQIPDIISKSIDFMKRKAHAASNIDPNENQHSISIDNISDFDPQAVRQGNAFIIAGACFSLGLRFAGSGNRSAAAAIFEHALYFIELRDNKDIVYQVQKPDTPTLVTCICTAAISLAMVMAGTGDIDSFRLFRALRWRCEDSTLYGSHQAFGAAIGLLFLGGGKCTLGSSPRDVAILIAAFFPHFPVLSADNQYHLQALRHLYVLATYDRILESVDIESGEKVCVPIEMTTSNDKIEVSTPYLVSSDADFSEMRTISDRYFPIVINTSEWKNALPTLFVKHRPGHLSYLQDPNALQSLSIQTEGESFLKSISLFSNDPVLSSFATYFCTAKKRNGAAMFGKFFNSIAYECMKDETSEMLPYYLNLFRLAESCNCESITIQNVWDVRLLQSYTQRKIGRVTSVNLLNSKFIAHVCQKLDDLLASPELHLLIQRESWGENDGAVLVWNGVPLRWRM